MQSIFIGLLALILGGVFSAVFDKTGKMPGMFSILSIALASFLIIPKALNVLLYNEVLTTTVNFSIPMGFVRLEVDGLSAFFIIIVLILSFISTLFSHGYVGHCCKKHYGVGKHFLFHNVLIASMVAVVMVKNILAFMIVWEVMTISSFLTLVLHSEVKEIKDTAVHYFVSMHIGAFFILFAFLISCVNGGGKLDFNSISEVFLQSNVNPTLLFLLFFVGFSFKIGILPFHTWVAYTYPNAPGGAAAVMAGVMKAMGVYGVLRIVELMDKPTAWMGYSVLAVSVMSALFGVIQAILYNDVKKTLSYSSIENAGVIGIAISAGLLGLSYNIPAMAFLGFGGAIFHVLNHGIYKGLLFFAINTVYLQTNTSNVDKLGGVIKKMPLTSMGFLIGALAITGLPPFNGFISKFFIYNSFLQLNSSVSQPLLVSISVLCMAVLALTGALALFAFAKSFGIAFLGEPRSDVVNNISENNCWLTFPTIIMAGLCVIIGIWPELVIKMLDTPIKTIGVVYESYSMETAKSVSGAFIVFLLIFGLIIFLRYLLLRNKNVQKVSTWRCGYGAFNAKMQYTGSSFSEPVAKLAKPILSIREDVKKPDGLFPESPLVYNSTIYDLIEAGFINWLWSKLQQLLNKFSWIQSGHIGHYLFYILVTLVLAMGVVIWRA